MNLWIYNHYATTPYQTGGTRHHDLSKELIKRGHKVTIVASSFNHFNRRETVSYINEKYKLDYVDGVRYLWVKTPSYGGFVKRVLNILIYTIRANKFSRKIIKEERPNIIIGSSVHPFAALLAQRIAHKFKCMFYFEERDLWPQTFIDFGKLNKRHPISKALFALEHYLYKKSRRIIVLFDKASNYVISKGQRKEKVLYLPNGVNYQNFDKIDKLKKSISCFDSLEDKFIVGYTGSHGIANNLESFVDLAEKVGELNSNIHFVSLGNGTEKQKLVNTSKERKLKNITFIDSIPKQDIPLFLSKVDLTFLAMKDSPLYKWGFSMNKIYDYMASGKPIIIKSNPNLTTSIRNSGGVISSNSINELAEKIIDLYKNKEVINEMSKNVKKFVFDNHSWEKLSLHLEKVMIKDLKENNHEEVI
jgi:glycosyltransferase involved in cell wall biosynthesis